MDMVTVAVPEELGPLDTDSRPWLRVVTWDGRTPGPEAQVQVDIWVPPYGLALDRDTAAASLGSLGGVRVVQLMSAGVEPWPDLVPEGVTLCNGRGVHGGSTAELAVTLALALLRDLPRYVDQQRQRRWRGHRAETLTGCPVVVLGAGDIGRRVASVLEALEAEVVVVGRRRRDGVRTLDDAQEDLTRARVLVVAVPHTPETTGLVDKELLAALPDGAIVVNVARGGVLDTAALTDEVARGRLRAGLDVTDPEPLPEDHPLWTLPGVVITPHVGGGTSGWADRARALVHDQVDRMHADDELRNVVTDGY